jgi:hypothetical protein
MALTADQPYTNQSVGRDRVPRLCAVSFSQGSSLLPPQIAGIAAGQLPPLSGGVWSRENRFSWE